MATWTPRRKLRGREQMGLGVKSRKDGLIGYAGPVRELKLGV